jgi:hypothetical protein
LLGLLLLRAGQSEALQGGHKAAGGAVQSQQVPHTHSRSQEIAGG